MSELEVKRNHRCHPAAPAAWAAYPEQWGLPFSDPAGQRRRSRLDCQLTLELIRAAFGRRIELLVIFN